MLRESARGPPQGGGRTMAPCQRLEAGGRGSTGPSQTTFCPPFGPFISTGARSRSLRLNLALRPASLAGPHASQGALLGLGDMHPGGDVIEPEGKQRQLSAYNLFVRAKLLEFKEMNPDMPQVPLLHARALSRLRAHFPPTACYSPRKYVP